MQDTLSPLVIQRQRRFLASLPKKIEELRSEVAPLTKEEEPDTAKDVRAVTDKLRRKAQALLGAGPVYNLPTVTDWARDFIEFLEEAGRKGRGDEEGLALQLERWLNDLEAMRVDLLSKADTTDQEAASMAQAANAPEPAVSPEEERTFSMTSSAVPKAAESQPSPDVRPAEVSFTEHSIPGQAVLGEVSWSQLAKGEKHLSTPATFDFPEKKVAIDELIESLSVMPITPSMIPEEPEDTAAGKDVQEKRKMAFAVGVVDSDPAVIETVRKALKHGVFNIVSFSSPAEVYRWASETAPDIILLDPTIQGSAEAVSALTSDPLTSSIPIVLLGGLSPGEEGVSWCPKPLDPVRLGHVIQKNLYISGPPEDEVVAADLRVTNLSGLTDFISSELRHGLVETAFGSASKPFPLKSQAQVLAATWSLVAVARNAVHMASRGEIKFQPSSRGKVGLMTLSAFEESQWPIREDERVDDREIEDLAGLTVMVADDDAGVRKVFEAILAEAGLDVITAEDGLDALSKIRSRRPDVVISDILMPRMDGWELLSLMRQDFTLRFLPVILISWKEDFIQRLKELSAGADGYLRKESDTRQILERIANVLRTRRVLERKLSEGKSSAVTGRIEGLGAITVIDSVRRLRKKAVVTFRDNYGVFEAIIDNGELVRVMLPDTKEGETTDEKNLERLIAMSGGRFTVEPLDKEVERAFLHGTWPALQKAAHHLNELVSQTAEGAVMKVKTLALDPKEAEAYKQVIPPRLQKVVERLMKGDCPRDLVLSSVLSPRDLESLVMDLIRRGVVKGIESLPSGEGSDLDELAMARMNRQEPPPIKHSMEETKPGKAEVAVARPAGGFAGIIWSLLISPSRAVAVGLALLIIGVLAGWLISLPTGRGPAVGEPEAPVTADVKLGAPVLRTPEPATPPEQPAPAEVKPAQPEPVALPAVELVKQPEEPGAPEARPEALAEAAPREAAREPRTRSREREARTLSAPPAASAPGGAPAAQAAGADTGTLVVSQQPGLNKPVEVFVDGKRMGVAPLTLTLKPGLHEVKFVAGGSSSIRMVQIVKGMTKKVAPSIEVK